MNRVIILVAAVFITIILSVGAYATPLPPLPAYACINVMDADSGEYLSNYQYTQEETFASPYEFMSDSYSLTIVPAGPQNISLYAAPESYTTEITISTAKEGYNNPDTVSFNNSYYWDVFMNMSEEACVVSHTFYLKKNVVNPVPGGSSSGGGTITVPPKNITAPPKTPANITKPRQAENDDNTIEEGEPELQLNDKTSGPTGLFLIGNIGALLQAFIEAIISFFQGLF